jgi:hypothetical protein
MVTTQYQAIHVHTYVRITNGGKNHQWREKITNGGEKSPMAGKITNGGKNHQWREKITNGGEKSPMAGKITNGGKKSPMALAPSRELTNKMITQMCIILRTVCIACPFI